jgi:hypothetical protein
MPISLLTGKRTPRQWDAWTHEEEETFFIALRHFGKVFLFSFAFDYTSSCTLSCFG